MFKSDRTYVGLDDYFYTNLLQDHVRSNAHIKERISQIEALYEPWQYNPFWRHSDDKYSNDWKNAFCKQSMDLMAEAANCYILGFFRTSAIASSTAVEQLLHIDAKSSKVKRRTTDGSTYLITEYDDNLANLLPAAKKRGYPIDSLLDPNEKDLTTCIFVQRRNILSHGVYEGEFVIEQIHYLNIFQALADKSNKDFLFFNATSSLDQYKKASKFIIATFKKFDDERAPACLLTDLSNEVLE